MEQLINAIDTQIELMEKDTSIGVTPLNKLLIQLSKARGQAKKDAKNLKTSYDINVFRKKDEREKQLIDKKEKVTDAECKRYADFELMEDMKEQKEKEAEADYIQPIVEAYINYVAWFKSDRSDGIKISRFSDN